MILVLLTTINRNASQILLSVRRSNQITGKASPAKAAGVRHALRRLHKSWCARSRAVRPGRDAAQRGLDADEVIFWDDPRFDN